MVIPDDEIDWQQLGIFDDDRTIQQRFEEFHKENPHVYELLVRYADAVRERGWENYGIGAVFERIRWHIDIETKDDRGFKLNNDFRSRYARKLMQEHPRFYGLFRIRKLRTP